MGKDSRLRLLVLRGKSSKSETFVESLAKENQRDLSLPSRTGVMVTLFQIFTQDFLKSLQKWEKGQCICRVREFPMRTWNI